MKNDEKAYLIKYNCLKLIKTWHLKLNEEKQQRKCNLQR